jgi:hypothetical protein
MNASLGHCGLLSLYQREDTGPQKDIYETGMHEDMYDLGPQKDIHDTGPPGFSSTAYPSDTNPAIETSELCSTRSLSEQPSSSGSEWIPVRVRRGATRRSAHDHKSAAEEGSKAPTRGRGTTGPVVLDRQSLSFPPAGNGFAAAADDSAYYGGVDIAAGGGSGGRRRVPGGTGAEFAGRGRGARPPRADHNPRVGHFSDISWWVQGTLGYRPNGPIPGPARGTLSSGPGLSRGPSPDPGRGGGGLDGGPSSRGGPGPGWGPGPDRGSGLPDGVRGVGARTVPMHGMAVRTEAARAHVLEAARWPKELAMHFLGGAEAQSKPEFEHVLCFLRVAMVCI